jgi:CubicO group peptidase (beta-lactamase class C family)
MRNPISYILLTILICSVSCENKQGKRLKPSITEIKINDYLTNWESNGFNGSVLVVKNDTIILNKGYGLANKEDAIPNTSKTIFDICSVTKQFTAAAILKLAEDEKLNLADSLKIYFKDIPLDKSKITIHQLLTHSAGFGHGIGSGDFDHISQDSYFRQLFNTKLLFQSGEKYAYSNSGYSILGRIIELASEKSYESYLKEQFFDPLGMEQTGYLLPKWDRSKISNEYLYNVVNKGNQISKYEKDDKIAWSLKANGGINSTQEDMYKWYLALKNHEILSKSSIEKLTAPHILEYEGESSYYGYGWVALQSDRDTKVITHNGFNGVSYYEFIWFPEENALILFATNTSTRDISRIPYEIEKMLFDTNYITKPILKNSVSELLEFTESYSGDAKMLSKELKSKYEKLISTPSNLNRLTGIYLREKNIEKALIISELNTQLFPVDGNVWDTMGDVYLANGQNIKAKKSYEKALDFKPKDDECFWCENSFEQLEKLKSEK